MPAVGRCMVPSLQATHSPCVCQILADAVAKTVRLGKEWPWGKGIFFCSLLIEDCPSDLRKVLETGRAFPGWEHRCLGQQVRPSDRLGLVQAQLERARAEPAAVGGRSSQADREAEVCRKRSSPREAGRGQDAGPSREAMLSVWLVTEGMGRDLGACFL